MFGDGHHHDGQNRPAYPPAAGAGAGAHQPTFKIFCKADEDYCLTVRDGNVVLAPANPRDEHQHWFKDMRFSTQIKDEEGNPAFALVNKATGLAIKHSLGLAIKHSLGQSHPVKLVPFKIEYPDESVLWTESGDVGKGFRGIRMVNNIRLNFDALRGDKEHGYVHDGTTVVLWEWVRGDYQSWKIAPWADEGNTAGAGNASRAGEPTHIFCEAITVSNGAVCLAPSNLPHWTNDMLPAWVTGKAIKHSQGEGHPVKSLPYNPKYEDAPVLSSESRDVGHGFRCPNNHLNCDKDHVGAREGTKFVLGRWCDGQIETWKLVAWLFLLLLLDALCRSCFGLLSP